MRTVPTEENNDKLPLRFLPSFDSNVVASNDAMQDTSFPFDSFIRFDQCFSKNIQNPFFFARESQFAPFARCEGKRLSLLERKDNRGAYARRVYVTRGWKLVARYRYAESSRASRYVTPPRRNSADHNDSSGRRKLIERIDEAWIGREKR